MARGINKVTLLGNLGNDPEMNTTNSGNTVCNLSIATSETWKDKQTGQPQERTEWHRIVLFGGFAEVAGQYLRKGSKVYLEGKLQTRKWQDQNGQDRYSTEIVVDGIHGTMLMLDSANGGNNNGYPQQPQGQGQRHIQTQPQRSYSQSQQYQAPNNNYRNAQNGNNNNGGYRR